MTKKINSAILIAALFTIGSSATAIADQIDEQHSQFLSQVAVAKNKGNISAKQAAKLDGELKEFSKLKRRLRDEHGDVLSVEDRLKLNQTLNKSRQEFDTMMNKKVAAETSKHAEGEKKTGHSDVK